MESGPAAVRSEIGADQTSFPGSGSAWLGSASTEQAREPFMSTRKPESPTELAPYREQANALAEALGKVKDIQQQTAAVTSQRETVLKQRQRLLDSFEDESAVAELSKLGSRVEMHDAKLASLAGKLAGARSKHCYDHTQLNDSDSRRSARFV
jgi:hypothetical protein